MPQTATVPAPVPPAGPSISTLPENLRIDARHITAHQINGVNDAIGVFAIDPPGPGGASHRYAITHPDPERKFEGTKVVEINFQNGPARQAHSDGVTNESLLAILIDRQRGFQSGKFACIENQIALGHLEAAMAILQYRTEARIRRNVEGTNIP